MARLIRALLGVRQHLHSLLVLRRELLPLQLERWQETLEQAQFVTLLLE